MSKQYFLATAEGAQTGPYSVETLETLNITPATLVWCDGMTKWEKAEKIEDLQPFLKAPAPPPVPIDHTKIPQISIAAPVLTAIYQPVKMTDKRDYTYIYVAAAAIIFLLLIIFFVAFAFPAHNPTDLAAAKTRTETDANADISPTYNANYIAPDENENTYAAPAPDKNLAAEQEAKAAKAAQRANEKAEQERKKEAALREQIRAQQQQAQQQQDERNRQRQQQARIAANIKSYLTADCSYHADKILGGISNGTVNIYNNSGYIIDRAVYQISYWQRNGDLYKIEEVYSDNINTTAYIPLPNSPRGIKITIKLVMVQSAALNLMKYF